MQSVSLLLWCIHLAAQSLDALHTARENSDQTGHSPIRLKADQSLCWVHRFCPALTQLIQED